MSKLIIKISWPTDKWMTLSTPDRQFNNMVIDWYQEFKTAKEEE